MPPSDATSRDGEATRQRLLALIRDSPGVHKSALCDASSLAWGTVDYHLRLLVRAGQVTLARAGRQTKVFPGRLSEERERLLATLAREPTARIAGALKERPDQGLGALVDRLGLSPKVVRRHIVRLLEHGLLERAGRHRPLYRLRPGAVELLDAPEPGTAPVVVVPLDQGTR